MRKIREFFDARKVLEVETPLLSQHASVDRHIESFELGQRWLQTSPEFAMKRLLCAGTGPIWQSCKVFRLEEAGRFHNPEFTMLEWYRPGFDHHALMDEVEALLRALDVCDDSACERLSYGEAFVLHAQIDPQTAPAEAMKASLLRSGASPPERLTAEDEASKDFWLDLLMSFVVAPKLGLERPCFVYHFPLSQAALARTSGDHAERFEVFWRGVEIANGFHELADAGEQQSRFELEQAWRREHGRKVPPFDAHLISALEAGLPDCSGVALGIDRLLMLLLKVPTIGSVLSFEWARA